MRFRALSAIAATLCLFTSAYKTFAASYYCSSDMRLPTIYFSAPFDAQSSTYHDVLDSWRAYLKQKYNFDPPADHQSACYANGNASDLQSTKSNEEKHIVAIKQSGKRRVIETAWALNSTAATLPITSHVTQAPLSTPQHGLPATKQSAQTQKKVVPKTTVAQAPTSLLIFSAGKNGIYHAATDGETMSQIRKELARRANDLKDGNAAFALARDMQYPSIAEWTGDRSAAKPWYVLSYKLGNVNGKYRVGSYYISGEFQDIPRNPAYGNQLMAEAQSTPGWDPAMLMEPDRGGVEAEHHFREGSHNYSPTGSANSRDALIPILGALFMDDAIHGRIAPPRQQTCNITSTYCTSDGIYNHCEPEFRTGVGSECAY